MREHEIRSEAFAACPFSIAQDYATDYLRVAETSKSAARIRVPLRVLPGALSRRVALSFGLHFDVAERGRVHDEIRLHWNAGSALLPNFRGTIRLRIASPGTTVITEGTYAVPLGAIGAWFDTMFGARIAQASIDDFTKRIAGSLADHERAWRTEIPA